MNYAIVGDIVSSKSIEQRTEMQNKLQNILDSMNKDYSRCFIKKFAITLGDEFQALFQDFKFVLEIVYKIQVKMWPVKIRFGIGSGEILVNLSDYDNPYNSDGPVWWNSRNAINSIKKYNMTNKIMDQSNVMIKTNNEKFDELLNSSLSLCYSINTTWTKPQRELIHYIILRYGLSDNFVKKNLATEYSQSESTIYSKLKISKYYNYLRILNAIEKFMIYRKGEEGNV